VISRVGRSDRRSLKWIYRQGEYIVWPLPFCLSGVSAQAACPPGGGCSAQIVTITPAGSEMYTTWYNCLIGNEPYEPSRAESTPSWVSLGDLRALLSMVSARLVLTELTPGSARLGSLPSLNLTICCLIRIHTCASGLIKSGKWVRAPNIKNINVQKFSILRYSNPQIPVLGL
jgi:hypothetical protein